MDLAVLRLYTSWELLWVEQQKQLHLWVCKICTLYLFNLLCRLRSHQCYSRQSGFPPNLLSSPQVLIIPSKCCFRVLSNTNKSHLLHSWAQSQTQHSILLHTWASWTLCLIFGSKCVHPVKLNTLCLPLSITESLRKCFYVSNSSFKLSSSISPTNCVAIIIIFGLRYTLCVVHVLFVYSRGIKKATEQLMTKLTLVSFFGRDELCSFAMRKLRSAFERIEKLGHLGQKSVPTKHLFVCGTKLFFEVCVLHFWQVFFLFSDKERHFC